MLWKLVTLAILASLVFGAKPPVVKLDDATVIGLSSGLNDQFLGIPFAQAPYVYPPSHILHFVAYRHL